MSILKWRIGRSIVTRVRRFKGERLLKWVFPSVNHYTVITWRRVNPRYNMEGGDFTNINCWNLADLTFCRTHIGAIWVQLLMGREKWTDGFRQQVVIISNPGSEYLIPPRDISFDDYPTPPNPDLIPDVEYPRGRLGDFRPKNDV